jgi:hypothetical protein
LSNFPESLLCATGAVLYSLAKFNESDFDIASTPSEKILFSRQQPHPRGDDRERITRARQAAEALFTAKSPASTLSVPVPDTPSTDRSARKPRVLEITSPSPARHDEAESPIAPPAREIPRSQFPRIRTFAKYGMTVAQVAQVYGVAVDEIKRILRKA